MQIFIPFSDKSYQGIYCADGMYNSYLSYIIMIVTWESRGCDNLFIPEEVK